jgi:hypothetical protein
MVRAIALQVFPIKSVLYVVTVEVKNQLENVDSFVQPGMLSTVHSQQGERPPASYVLEVKGAYISIIRR